MMIFPTHLQTSPFANLVISLPYLHSYARFIHLYLHNSWLSSFNPSPINGFSDLFQNYMERDAHSLCISDLRTATVHSCLLKNWRKIQRNLRVSRNLNQLEFLMVDKLCLGMPQIHLSQTAGASLTAPTVNCRWPGFPKSSLG